MGGSANSATARAAPAARVAAISDVIDAHGDALERDRRMPAPLLDALHDQALFRMLLPKPFGGEEASPPEFMAAIEALARHDASVAWCVCQANGCAMTAAYMAPEIADKIWGQDPRAVVAWGPGRSEVVEADGGYRLTADLMFASGGRHATWLGAHSTVKTASGEVRRGPDGKADLRTFLMPANTIEMHDIWDVIGLRGTASDGYRLENVFVPAAHSALRDDPRDLVYRSPLYLYPAMTHYAVGFASVALGIAQGFLGDFLTFAQGKTPRLSKSTVAASAVAQAETALASARIMAARAFLKQETEQVWAETVRDNALSVPSRVRIRLASTFAIHEAKTAVDALYDLAGADAIFATGPFERRFRDIHTVTQQLQGRKTHLQSIGAWMLGGEADLSVM